MQDILLLGGNRDILIKEDKRHSSEALCVPFPNNIWNPGTAYIKENHEALFS